MDECHPVFMDRVELSDAMDSNYTSYRQRYHGTLVSKLDNRHMWSISRLFCLESVAGDQKAIKGVEEDILLKSVQG